MRFHYFAPNAAGFRNSGFPYAKNGHNNCQQTTGVNIAETKDAFEIEVLLPGFTKEEVAVKVEGNLLTITAQKETQPQNTETRKYNHREFTFTNFKRTFEIDDLIEVNAIKATQNNGVLLLALPKKEAAKPVSLQIEVQ